MRQDRAIFADAASSASGIVFFSTSCYCRAVDENSQGATDVTNVDIRRIGSAAYAESKKGIEFVI
jgi:hypothetical protein